MKKLCMFCLLTAAWAGLAQGLPGQQATDLKWDLKILKAGEAVPNNRNIQTISIEAGQSVTMIISPASGSFCYILEPELRQKIVTAA
jgi:hypothetical protein